VTSAARSVVGLATALLASGASAAPLTLDELVQGVEARYPLVEAARQEQRAAEGEWNVAQGAFEPSLRLRAAGEPVSGYGNLRLDTQFDQPLGPLGANLFGGYRLGLGDFAVYDGKLKTNEAGELRAGASVSLLRNRDTDRRRTTLRRAEAGRDVAAAAYGQQLLDATRAAANRYWDWVAAGARLEVARALLDVARQRDAWLAKRVATGEVPAVDRVDNARAIEQRQQSVISAERSRDQAAIELSLLWRDDEGRPVLVSEDRLPRLEPPPDRPPQPLDDILAEALERRPDVARVRASRVQAEAELALATNQTMPGLDAAVAVSQDLGGSPDGDLKRGKIIVEGSLLLDVPLQARLLTGRETAADAGLARIRAQERLARDRVRADLLDATNAVSAASRRLDSARRELAAAREVEQGERLRYELGESNLIFVNLREQQSAETALREADALLELHKARAALDVARGARPASR